MNYLRSSFAALTASLLAAHGLQAQTTATTDPVGFMTIPTPAGSDTIVAAPLTKPPVFQGAVSSRSNFVITVSPSPNFSNLAATPHYVQPVTGSQSGMIFDVATNTSNTITLVDNGVTPSGLDPSNSFKVVPYWTIAEVFPPSDANVSFTPSATATGPNRRTQILLPNVLGAGVNRAPSTTLYFLATSNYWRTTGIDANAGSTPILPDSYFVVRQTTNSGTNLATTIAGNVNTGRMVVPLDSLGGTNNDNYVSLGRPVDITLNDLGLITSGAFTPSAGTTGPARRDLLQVISNSVVAFNKAPSVTYYYVNSGTNVGWRTTGDGTTDVGTNVLTAATGYVIRKASQNPAGTVFWTNTITIAP